MRGYKAAPVDELAEEWRIEQNDIAVYDRETCKRVILEESVAAEIGMRKKAEDGTAKAAEFQRLKGSVVSSQNRAETKLAKAFERAYERYIDALLLTASSALLKRTDVRQSLASRKHEREQLWTDEAIPTLQTAMERGFSLALSQVKATGDIVTKARKPASAAFPGINETDRQAVDYLRERGRDGKRETLKRRSISRFVGLDETKTEQVMQIIEDGEKDGKTFEQIARTIRDDFGEAYRNQSRTIVRTELLTAISEGLAWNHEVLGQVFSEVQKQWIHQGDVGLNPDAREEHAELEGSPIGGNESWRVVDSKTGVAYELRYPRDPTAPASGIINCRCSMVTVIPDSATSNADSILEGQ
jgi:hypothetical protein